MLKSCLSDDKMPGRDILYLGGVKLFSPGNYYSAARLAWISEKGNKVKTARFNGGELRR